MDKLLGCSPTCSSSRRAPVSALADKQVVGLYFSAHWCPPCRGFTPKLAEVYTAIKGTGKSLEIVFVSSDRDDVAFDSYHKEMPWQTLSKRFKVSGIPSLVPCRRRDRPGALQGRPQRHHERPSGHRLSAPKTLDELLGEVLLDGEGAELPRDQGGSNAYRVGSFSMFDLCRWTPGPSGTPPPTVGRTTTAHTRDDDQEGRQHDTRTRTRDRRTAVAEQTTLEKEAWNMPGTWKRTPPPHVRFADTEQMFHSTEEMHQV